MKKHADAISDYRNALRYSPEPRNYTEINLDLAEAFLEKELLNEAKVGEDGKINKLKIMKIFSV